MTRPSILAVTIVLLGTAALAGCQKAGPSPAGVSWLSGKPRYVGVGIYAAGRMWAQLVQAQAAKDPAAATLDDDEQVIVVIDSATGELRQCGNLSGYCTRMNPWSATPSPAAVVRHAVQLQADDARRGN
ncbi:MAG: hypothetical protein JF588_18895 [Caulobacterales bacterium]|nr:hypothetical protein [Caulobacterales bacterium]